MGPGDRHMTRSPGIAVSWTRSRPRQGPLDGRGYRCTRMLDPGIALVVIMVVLVPLILSLTLLTLALVDRD